MSNRRHEALAMLASPATYYKARLTLDMLQVIIMNFAFQPVPAYDILSTWKKLTQHLTCQLAAYIL